MRPNDYSRIDEWLDNNREVLVKTTQDLVRAPSVSGQEYDAQKRVSSMLQSMGLEPSMVFPDEKRLRSHPDFFETTSFRKYGYENRPNIATTLRGTGGGRSICLSGHIDVVSPQPTDRWSRDPWSGDVVGDAIQGRGAGDMKAGIASMLGAVRALQECEVSLKGDIGIETTIEEEDGGVGGVLYMRTVQQKADAALVPEPTGLMITVASAGVMYFRVTVPGVPAHAATAHYGVNAIIKALPVIEAINRLHEERQKRISYPYAEVDPTMKGRATTINLGVIRAGDWPSTVPAPCVMEYRIGWPPGETIEEVRKQVEQTVESAARRDPFLAKTRPKVEWYGWNARPHEQDPKHPFVQTVKSSVASVTAGEPILYGGSAGLDTRHFVHSGTPAVTMGPKAERIHSYDESVSITSIVQSAKVIARTLIDWCGVRAR